MEKKRKNYSGEEKIRILKEHLVNGVAVSELCDKHKIHPTLFYRWQQQLFENGAKVFESGNNQEKTQMKQQIAKLEEKVAKRNEVLSELMEAHTALKKSLGED